MGTAETAGACERSKQIVEKIFRGFWKAFRANPRHTK